MNRLSSSIANWLYKQGAITKEDKELYEYAAYCFVITIAPLTMALLCSAMIGGVKQYITILIPFMCLRQYSGGYHAKNVWFCMVSSFFSLVFIVWLAMKDTGGLIHWILLIMSAIIIIINSPIESDNRKMSEQEKIEYHENAVKILGVFVIIEILLELLGMEMYANSIGVGIMLVAISQSVYFLNIIIKKIYINF